MYFSEKTIFSRDIPYVSSLPATSDSDGNHWPSDALGVPSGTPVPNSNMRAPFSGSGSSQGLASSTVETQPTLHRIAQPTSFPQPLSANSGIANSVVAANAPQPNLISAAPGVQVPPTAIVMADNQAWAQPGMVPDFAKAETMVFPGDANGPDLNAAPMSFTPTVNLSSLFRFDVTKQWITSRWDRVSTCPADQGLHGMRVALVTGTNSWDLHGSLTYYFDANHRVQRITYRGWTGDATRLVQTLQKQVQLRAQPTHWAGLYLSKRSGLLMKHPAVIDKNNPVQQLALIMEINNPAGKTPLSNDFQSLLPAAMATH